MFMSEVKPKGKPKKVSKPENTSVAPVINSGKPKRPWYKHGFVFAILGLALFLVFVSIAYSAVIIYTGTSNLTPKIMIAPMVLFDLVLAGIAFSKIFK